jgi:ankyrin repeat protein
MPMNGILTATETSDIEAVKTLFASVSSKGEAAQLANTKDTSHWRLSSPLTIACREGQCEMASLLIDNGAEMNYQDGGGLTALAWAAGNGHAEVVSFLLGKGADPSIQGTIGGCTPVIRAARDGHMEVVKQLLKVRGAQKAMNGVDIVVQTDRSGKAALAYAEAAGYSDIAQLLRGEQRNE